MILNVSIKTFRPKILRYICLLLIFFQIKCQKVLLIGIDGLLSQCLNDADHSAWETLTERGAYSFKSRANIESYGAPGWSSILCGMTVEQTGITTNSWIIQNYFLRVNRISTVTYPEMLPCIFKELKMKKGKDFINYSVFNWEFILNFGNTFSEEKIIDKEIFKLSIDSVEGYKQTDKELVETALKLIDEDYGFFFLYLRGLDKIGHEFGFRSQEYIDYLSAINGYLQQIIDKFKIDDYLILTSDHGADYLGKSHGNQRDDNLLVPFIINGPKIKQNYEIKSSVRLVDITPTIFNIYGVTTNPIWRGRLIYDIFN
jgi:predicted AlkP superfamily phosphohydrolase/phosphomutase